MRPDRLPLLGVVVVVLLLSGGAGTLHLAHAQTDPGGAAITVELITDQLDRPVSVTHAGDGSGRLFVVEKKGRIKIVRDGKLAETPFLDLTSIVNADGSEQGLLSVAFHPRYRTNGLFYVGYTDSIAQNDFVVFAAYRVSSDDPDVADPTSAVTLLRVQKPDRRETGHNSGRVVFGPDGYLYLGVGDGGIQKDPAGNAQNKGLLLGKLLRVDVNSGEPYSIPPDNPFVNEPETRPEIWAYGLRNPWTFSFDRATGDLYVTDVGDIFWEEINRQRAGTSGQNYGWNLVEGRHCSRSNRRCDLSEYEQFEYPIAEYRHQQEEPVGCAVIGGHVYRGPSFPQLHGLYFFGDFCSGRIFSLQEQPSGTWLQRDVADTDLYISGFGEDEAGDLYLTSLRPPGLHRLQSAP